MSNRARPRRRGLRVFVSAAAVAASVFAAALPAAARGTDMGTAEVVVGGGSTDRITKGDSATPFSIRLPGKAECPGDSADGGYRVQSFLVPVKDDPGALTYRSVMPVGEGRYALYDIHTNPYIQSLTAKATKQGGPGPIVNIPDLSFAVFPPGRLPAGRYTIGIACSLNNETVRFWDIDIELEHDPDDVPAQLRWRVLPAPDSGEDERIVWPLAAGAAAVAAVAVGARQLSRRGAPT